MDESYLLAAARYIEMNPVAAQLASRPADYPWSSASAHLAGVDDRLVKVEPLLALVPDWAKFLQLTSPEEVETLQRHERTGRPLGNDSFIDDLETALGRILRPQKPGPKSSLDGG
jgi:putative transposase